MPRLRHMLYVDLWRTYENIQHWLSLALSLISDFLNYLMFVKNKVEPMGDIIQSTQIPSKENEMLDLYLTFRTKQTMYL